MLLRLLAGCSVAAICWAASDLPPAEVTGMLEYASPAAVVVRLEDHREIQIQIPEGMARVADGREIGGWVEVSFEHARRTLDKG